MKLLEKCLKSVIESFQTPDVPVSIIYVPPRGSVNWGNGKQLMRSRTDLDSPKMCTEHFTSSRCAQIADISVHNAKLFPIICRVMVWSGLEFMLGK